MFFEDAYAALSRSSPAAVDFRNPARAPLLLIAGEHDHISPPSLNRAILKLQSRAPTATELKEYAGRTHFMAGMDGWKEIADYALNWALEHRQAPAAPVSEEAPDPAATSPTQRRLALLVRQLEELRDRGPVP